MSIAFSLCLPYLCVFPFTLLHLPLNFIRVSSLRLMYLHPLVDPSLTDFYVSFQAWDWLWYQMLWSQRWSGGAHEAEILFQISALAGVWTTRLRRIPHSICISYSLKLLQWSMTTSLSTNRWLQVITGVEFNCTYGSNVRQPIAHFASVLCEWEAEAMFGGVVGIDPRSMFIVCSLCRSATIHTNPSPPWLNGKYPSVYVLASSIIIVISRYLDALYACAITKLQLQYRRA